MKKLCRVPTRKTLAVAVTAMSIAAVVVAEAAPPASAAASFSGETLSGSGSWVLTTLDSAPNCAGTAFINRTGTFNIISGNATGPYPGTFTESGTLGISGTGGVYGTYHGYFNATFSITSGSTTITGTLSESGDTVGHCAMWGTNAYVLQNAPMAYTVVINGQTYQGAAGWPQTGALVNGTFPIDTWQASISEQFAGGGSTPAPTVTTGTSVNVGTTAATVWGTVDDKGEATTYRFDYGTSSTDYTAQTPPEPIPSSTQDVDARLTGLSPNTVYHYRIEATNSFGTSYGTDKTFTTTSTPSADLWTRISASQPNPSVGQNESFAITVTNDGPDAAQSVVVSDNWTTTSTFRSVSATAPSAATCTAPPVGSRGTVTCTTASLDLGQSITVVVTLRVRRLPLQDTATATSPTTADPNTANNTATLTIT